MNNSSSFSNNNNGNNKVSFKCFYDVKNINEEIQIINDRFKDKINKEIKSKIKILNGDKKEEVIFTKKFNKIGINTIDFIIEGKLTNMSCIFCDCDSLIKIEFISIDTSKVKDMKNMFSGCKSLEYLDLSIFDTSNVENMNSMFSCCSELKEIKYINNFNTSKVKDMNNMFFGCGSLEYLDLSNFDTSNVKDMGEMFENCSKLKEIKGINNFNTSKVKDMNAMFSGCESLEYLDLSNFDTSNVENMSGMFYYCSTLKEIKGINNFNTSKVKYMSAMLYGCKSLEYLDLSNFDTSNVKYMNGMFSYCSKLKEIKGINNFKNKKNCNIEGIFDGCNELDNAIISDNQNSTDIHKSIPKNEKNEKTIAIMFFILDKNIHYPIPCNESDSFSKIENKLLEEFPELKSKNIYYLVSGNTVDKTLTLKENRIKNGDTVLVEFIEN